MPPVAAEATLGAPWCLSYCHQQRDARHPEGRECEPFTRKGEGSSTYYLQLCRLTTVAPQRKHECQREEGSSTPDDPGVGGSGHELALDLARLGTRRRRDDAARGNLRRRVVRGRRRALGDLVLGEVAGLRVEQCPRVLLVHDDLPGGTRDQHGHVGSGGGQAGLLDRCVTALPFAVLPGGGLDLRLGDLRLAALDLGFGQRAGLGLGCHDDVGRVLDGDPLAVLEDDLEGRDGLGARLRHLGVSALPGFVLPVRVLDPRLRRRRRRVAAVARRRVVGRVGTLAGQRLVQEWRLERVVRSVELVRHRQGAEATLAHELRVDVVLTALLQLRRGVAERADLVDEHVVVADQRLGPRGVPGCRQDVHPRRWANCERVAERVALLGALGG